MNIFDFFKKNKRYNVNDLYICFIVNKNKLNSDIFDNSFKINYDAVLGYKILLKGKMVNYIDVETDIIYPNYFYKNTPLFPSNYTGFAVSIMSVHFPDYFITKSNKITLRKIIKLNEEIKDLYLNCSINSE